jgi:hypothetical protein
MKRYTLGHVDCVYGSVANRVVLLINIVVYKEIKRLIKVAVE